ncbi:hypothetical protein CEV33_0750 [Brucella grignonensis]|uniref:Uncharacterized protein n=1 Tax=Brucella grignonensis TaxID=94627 RepID=A0A256FHN4_9HYPH|nr:hypothetical protein CEV33_0750 [Brucella grignonensis]
MRDVAGIFDGIACLILRSGIAKAGRGFNKDAQHFQKAGPFPQQS